jgi:small-conductance mechanosensitive channel
MTNSSAQTESSSLRNLMLGATVLGVFALMASAFPLSMSPEIFDSGEDVATWSLFIGLWLMPVVLIAGLAIGWIGFARNARNLALLGLVLAALPLLVAIGILVMAG